MLVLLRMDGLTNLGDVGRDDSALPKKPQDIVQPARAIDFDILGQIQSRDRAKPDGKRLEEDGDQVRYQYHHEETESVRSAGGHVGGIIALVEARFISVAKFFANSVAERHTWVDVCHADQEPRPNKACIFRQLLPQHAGIIF